MTSEERWLQLVQAKKVTDLEVQGESGFMNCFPSGRLATCTASISLFLCISQLPFLFLSFLGSSLQGNFPLVKTPVKREAF
jgi:hypothetical protein